MRFQGPQPLVEVQEAKPPGGVRGNATIDFHRAIALCGIGNWLGDLETQATRKNYRIVWGRTIRGFDKGDSGSREYPPIFPDDGHTNLSG